AVTATPRVTASPEAPLWGESDNQLTHCQVYRATSTDATKAQPISDKLPATLPAQLKHSSDSNATRAQSNHCWVRSINPHGMSPLGHPREGFTGDGVTIPAAHEPFNYAAGANLDKLNGGDGFGEPWWVEEYNAPVIIAPEGLTYPGLKTSGRA